LNGICGELLKVIDGNEMSDFTLFPENLGIQRKITFKWQGKKMRDWRTLPNTKRLFLGQNVARYIKNLKKNKKVKLIFLAFLRI